MIVWLAVSCAGAAALLAVPAARPDGLGRPPAVDPAPSDGPRGGTSRLLVSLLAGLGVGLFVGGAATVPAALAATAVAWTVLARSEPRATRRERERVRRDLPHLVRLLAAGLRSGAAPGEALRVACAALPGPAGRRLEGVCARLDLGVDPVTVWTSLAADPDLAPLGRSLARAHVSGAPVADTVDRLATELADRGRHDAEERARSVGVRAAVPLGLCLLPAFVLIGIVPLVAGLLGSLDL